jgi:8-oxo-dGTP pyrophosphatase MutT (NUDIX family)
MIKHATAGGFVFCRFPDEWRLGLVEHPRMGVLACPGGHVEDDESPAEAAVREIEEETGLAGVRLLGFPEPAVPAGFPATHAQVALPWWITEIEVPPDNHLASPHVHIDHVWVAIAPHADPASEPAHPFAWYTAGDIGRGLPMFEDSRVLAPVLFQSISGMRDGSVTGDGMLARLAVAGAS